MSNYTEPKRINDLDDVGASITTSSLYLVQDAVGNRLGYVRAADIVGTTDLDDIPAGSTNKHITINDLNEIISLRTDLIDHKDDFSNPHNLNKADVVLGNVDNTADIDKPISSAQDVGLVSQTLETGSAELPVGTTAQRDNLPSVGFIRFNTETGVFEGYNGSAWITIA